MKFSYTIIFCSLILAGLCACTTSTLPEEAQPPVPELELVVGTCVDMNSDFGQLLHKTAQTVDGLKLTFYGSNTLGSNQNMLSGVQLGTLSMFLAPTDEFGEEYPAWSILNLPGLVQGCQLFNTWMKESYCNILNEQEPQKSFYILGCFGVDERVLCLSSPAETVADLAGRTIAVTDSAFQETYWKELGINTHPVLREEIVQAVWQKKCDMVSCTYNQYLRLQLYHILKYIIPNKASIDSYILLINQDIYEHLSPEARELLRQFVDAIWNELASDAWQAERPSYFDNGNCITLTPSYDFRYQLLDHLAALEQYRSQLGDEYVDGVLEYLRRQYTTRS